MRTLLLSVILLITTGIAHAQTAKETTNIKQVWLGFFNQSRFSTHFGTWLDLHLRTKEDFTTNFSQSIVRGGLTYFVNDQTRLTAGYAYVTHYPGDNHKNISQPEHRPWQQISWSTKYTRLRTMQWFRLEERWRKKIINEGELGDGYQFNYRMRYNFLVNIPLSKVPFAPHTLAVTMNDEVHVNFGKEIVYNYFDQNRFFVGLSYQVNKHDNLQFGYMNLFQQLAAGNKYKSIHALRVFYFQNLDFR